MSASRSQIHAGRSLALLAWATVAALLATPIAARAQSATIVGYLANFDAINDTEGEKQGFEIELEGIQAADITRVFGQSGASCYIRYCIGSVTDVPAAIDPITHLTVPAHVSIKWTANYDAAAQRFLTPLHAPGGGTSGTPSRVGNPNAPLVNGEQCWSYGLAGAYPASGCEHFGVSTAPGKNPTHTVYRWLVGDPATGAITPVVVNIAPPGAPPVPAYAPPVAIPHPVAAVAVVGGAQQVQAVIQAPEPVRVAVAALAHRYGKAQWVKVYKTELDRNADLDELVGGDNPNGVIKDARAVAPETEWKLLQFDVSNPDKGGSQLKSGGSSNGKHAVVRRYEFYKYTGPVVTPGGTSGGGGKAGGTLSTDDQEDSNCLRATPGDKTTDCVSAPPEEVGDYIGAQMAAQNLLNVGGVVLVDQVITGFTLPVTVTIGDAPLTLNATGGGSLNPVRYAASGACSNVGGAAQIQIDATGSCIVTASQAGNAAFAAAPSQTQWVQVLFTQAITDFIVPAAAKVGDQFTATAVGGGSLEPVTFVASGGCSNDAGSALVTVNSTAACTVTASQAGNAFYAAAADLSRTVADAKATPIVTATGDTCTYSGNPCVGNGSAVGGVGESLAVTLSYAGTGATTYGPSASAPIDAGTYTVTVQTDGDESTEAGSTSASITITKASSTVSVTCSPSVTYTGAPLTVCTASASGINLAAVDVTASLVYANNVNAGAATATANFAGDGNHNGSTGTGAFTIAAASSTVTVSCTPSVIYTGGALTVCTASASGAGLGAVDVSASLVYAANVNVGAATATASYAGDANHSGSSGVGGFAITPAPSTVTVSCPASVPFSGSPLTPCSAVATGAALNVSLSVTYTANTNPGTATASATFAGDANHTGSSGSRTFVITAPPPTGISIAPIPDQTNKEGDEVEFNVVVTGGAGGRFSASGLPAGIRIDDEDGEIHGHITINPATVAPYSLTVTVTYSRNGVSVSRSFVWKIAPATPKGKGGKG